ncbi:MULTISPECIES: 50S ribosomal protein L21 [Chryseobacterium]|uniref:50S ribosomal protein L21 n=1 Tax=Chryseobacterium sp. R2A-55 TaxID=2744445 RepID=UPI001F1D0D62|nr:50S ribosomal protein L21 [Chryseobacterium sp. R2A-55]
MFAIVEIAGLQYKVEQDQKLFVNRLQGDKGAKVSFDKVLLTVNGTTTIGAPAVNGITVDAEILDHVKADKVIVFKKKRRKGYEKKNGHRQSLTQIQITGITGFDNKKEEKKAAPKAKKAAAASEDAPVAKKTTKKSDSETAE